ncbi:MAG: 23S rRNA (uracil(1939)-C(5))-methyltransferase RlmD [Clostridiales bacterium]|nr:23S rRNA (uracil(1939)-C(5))-methyltransferase RlmD [Clostridiales bacterium]
MLKINDVITYTATSYANSETVGVVDCYTVFVPHMLVGEVARVRINYVKGNVAYGDVVELVQRSANRVTPCCSHFGNCGGCTLAHMCYSEQLLFKRNKVVTNLLKIAKLDCNVLPCVGSSKITNYRNKLSLPVSGKRGNVTIGMYRRNSHSVVNVDDCALGGEWATTLVEIFRNYCNSVGVIPYNERTFQGEVRHLVARFVDGQLLATVVSNGEYRRDLQPLAKELSKRFDKFGLFVNVNTQHNNVILGKQTVHVCGLQYIEGEHLGVKFRLRPTSFFQVNDGVKDVIYGKVRELLDVSNTDVLVDCFSGVGILTNILASDKYDTYAIEIEPSAVQDANEMVQLNNTPRVTNICGDVTVELPRIVQANSGKRLTLVVDPPRKGLGETICNTLIQANIDNLVYISCDSATLARDLALLTQQYTPTYIQPYDMFPNTDQVETVVLLTRRQNN